MLNNAWILHFINNNVKIIGPINCIDKSICYNTNDRSNERFCVSVDIRRMLLNEKRLVFAGLDQDGYPVSAQELLAGEWQEVSLEVYYGIPSDVYLIEDSAGSGNLVWTDGDAFMVDANVETGNPPSPEEVERVYDAYLQHLRSTDETAELNGLIFVHEVSATE